MLIRSKKNQTKKLFHFLNCRRYTTKINSFSECHLGFSNIKHFEYIKKYLDISVELLFHKINFNLKACSPSLNNIFHEFIDYIYSINPRLRKITRLVRASIGLCKLKSYPP